MKSSTVLRLCLILEWLFGVIGIAVSFGLESSLPEPLAAWVRAEAEREATGLEMMLSLAFVVLLVAMFVATVGLLCLRRWAAWLYLIASVVGALLMPFFGPTVEHAVADTFYDLGSVMSGVVLALAFFTDSLARKSGAPAPPPLPRDRAAGAPGGGGLTFGA